MSEGRAEGEAVTAFLGGVLAAGLDDVLRESVVKAAVLGSAGWDDDLRGVRIDVLTAAGHRLAVDVRYVSTDT